METKVVNMVAESLLTNVWNANIFSKKKNMGTLLDPINTAIALCLLNYYPAGTKISIQNNEITFQEPSTMQGISRWKNGDSYEDIHNLVNPIKKLLQTKEDTSLWRDENFRYICETMKSGLSILAKTYADNHIANHTIEFYKSLIEENLQDKNHFLEKLDTAPEDFKDRRLSDGKFMYDIYNDFFEDWDFKQIEVAYTLLKNIGLEDKPEIKESYKECVHLLIKGRNQRVKQMIDKVKSGQL